LAKSYNEGYGKGFGNYRADIKSRLAILCF
jgi:hypothetical protein